MTTELYPGAGVHTINGTGPYAVGHEYTAGAIGAQVRTPFTVIDLDPADFSLSPDAGAGGDLTLSATVAATYAGLELVIRRRTIIEQGWAGASAREKGLEWQLDRHAQALQEAQDAAARSVRLSAGVMKPIIPVDGQTLIWDASAQTFVAGPPAVATNAFRAYATVSAFFSDIDLGFTAPDGTVKSAGPVQFMALSGANVAGLRPGWVPFGYTTPNHWKTNAVPGTTNMRDALVNAWAYTDDVHLLSEKYLISGATVVVLDGKRLTGRGWTNGYGGGVTKGSIIVEDRTTAGDVFRLEGPTNAFADRARTMFRDVGFISASGKILTNLTGIVVNLFMLDNAFTPVFENCLFNDLNVHAVFAGDPTGRQNGLMIKGGQVTSIGDARAGFQDITGRYTYGHGIDMSLIPDSEVNGAFVELCGRYGVRLGSNCRSIGVFNDLSWRGYELGGERAQVIGGGCKWHQQNGFYAAIDAKDWTVDNVNTIGNNYSNRLGNNENYAFRLTTGNTGWRITNVHAADALSPNHPLKTELQNFIHLGGLGNTGFIGAARIGGTAAGGTEIYDPFGNIAAGNIVGSVWRAGSNTWDFNGFPVDGMILSGGTF